MVDYAERLLAINEKKQKLLVEETKLVEKRKNEVGALAEKLGLLTVSDEFLTGLFHEAKQANDKKTNQAKEWERLGAQLNKSRTSKTDKNAHDKQHAEAT